MGSEARVLVDVMEIPESLADDQASSGAMMTLRSLSVRFVFTGARPEVDDDDQDDPAHVTPPSCG